MAPLRNARHERFCLALAEGHSISESYMLAGFKKNRGNACRLNADESVQRRTAELQAELAADSQVTRETIIKELAEAREVAKANKQSNAMVNASMGRGKMAGLLTEKIEVGPPGSFDDLTTVDAIVDREIELLQEQFVPFDAKDREGLRDLHKRHIREAEEYIAALKARPITAERVDLRRLDRPWREHASFSPKSATQRIGYTNGKTVKAERGLEREVIKQAETED